MADFEPVQGILSQEVQDEELAAAFAEIDAIFKSTSIVISEEPNIKFAPKTIFDLRDNGLVTLTIPDGRVSDLMSGGGLVQVADDIADLGQTVLDKFLPSRQIAVFAGLPLLRGSEDGPLKEHKQLIENFYFGLPAEIKDKTRPVMPTAYMAVAIARAWVSKFEEVTFLSGRIVSTDDSFYGIRGTMMVCLTGNEQGHLSDKISLISRYMFVEDKGFFAMPVLEPK